MISKSTFELTYYHNLVNYSCILMNIFNMLCNYVLFGMSFSDYFEFKEKVDYDELYIDRKNE